MGRKTKDQLVIFGLEQQLEEAKKNLEEATKTANYEREQRLILKGKNERFEKEEAQATNMVYEKRQEEFNGMLDQIDWLRGLVEKLAMPQEKFEAMLNAEPEIRMENRPFYEDLPRRRKYGIRS